MSFCSDYKEELMADAPHRKCCKNAYAAGLLYDLREVRENCLVMFQTSLAVRRECARVFREQYKRTALLNGPALLLASEELYATYMDLPKFDCPHCETNFLRGLVIACATVNDPEKSYHMEFHLDNPEKVAFLAEFFEEKGWHAGCRAVKTGGVGVYFKSGTVIEEIIGHTGANNAFFAYMDARIKRSIRSEENRVTNCETRNIGRSVSAAAKHCAAITRLERSGKILSLPIELRETATLRVAHPEASLKELAMLHNPPITKSGLNNRLLKILMAADDGADSAN